MFKLTFLRAGTPLTKTIRKDGSKSTYPNVKNFTSQTVEVNTIFDMGKIIKDMAYSVAKPCLIKGNLKKPLNNEPRKGTHSSNTVTHWICLDLDGAPFSTPDEFMRAIGFSNTSYVVQYSSSYGLTTSKGLNCHIFCVLSKPISPQDLKAWLMHLNMHVPVLESALRLSDQKNHIKWTLDITTCQNDKLLYIAAPVFENPKMDKVKPDQRIQVISRPDPTLDVSKIVLKPIAKLIKEKQEKLNNLRKAAGLEANKTKVKLVGEFSIQPNADQAKYEIVEEDDEFIRLNLDNGDSAAYYIIKAQPELIRNFKGEDFVYTKDVAPELYSHIIGEVHTTHNTPSANGDQIIAFREKRTAQYWKGIYNAADNHLDIDPIDSKDKLFDFLQSHNQAIPPYVPEWQLIFNPQSPIVIDTDNHIINRYIEPVLPTTPGNYPIIQQALDSAVGKGDIQEHFLNWLACIIQHKCKTETAWILHGKQGTGKGILINRVIRPLIGMTYTEHILASALSSDFDGWQEHKLLVFIDEIEVDMFEKKSGVEAKLKKMITEATDDIHRKGLTRYTAPSFVNLIFGSNKPHMVVIPPDDRRYNVGNFQPTRWRPDPNDIENKLPKELPAFLHYLKTRKADRSKARDILDTADRQAVQALSISSAHELAQDILSGNLQKLIDYLPDPGMLAQPHLLPPAAETYAMLVKSFAIDEVRTISRDQLQVIFQHCIGKVSESPNRFTTYLKHHGIKPIQVKLNGINVQGIHVNWKMTPELQREAIKRFAPKLPQPVRRVK